MSRLRWIGFVLVIPMIASAVSATRASNEITVDMRGYKVSDRQSVTFEPGILTTTWEGSDGLLRDVSFDLSQDLGSFLSISYDDKPIVTHTRLSAENIESDGGVVMDRIPTTYPITNCIVESQGDRVKVTFLPVMFGTEPGRVIYRFYGGLNYFSTQFLIDTKPLGIDMDIEVFLSNFNSVDELDKLLRLDVGELDDDGDPQPNVERPLVEENLGRTGHRDNLWTLRRIMVLSGPSGAIGFSPSPHRWAYIGHNKRPSLPKYGFVEDNGGRDIRAGLRLIRPGSFYNPTLVNCRYFLYIGGNGQSVMSAMRDFTNDDQWPTVYGWYNFLAHVHNIQMGNAMELGLDVVLDAAPHGMGYSDRVQRIAMLEKKNRQGTSLFILGEESGILDYGHTISLLPRPQPYSTHNDPDGGTQERYLGSPEEGIDYFKQEGGLLWWAHPGEAGIKASNILKLDYVGDPTIPGFSWRIKYDDSEKVGMGMHKHYYEILNRGYRKFQIAEVDWNNQSEPVLDHYASAAVNYTQSPKKPTWEDYDELPAVIREGQHFITSGEIFIHSATINGQPLPVVIPATRTTHQISLDLSWTYPLEQVEFILGYGVEDEANRDIRQITSNIEYGRSDFTWKVDLTNALWMRVEIYDIAGNVALTQPVFISNELPSDVVAIASASPTSGQAPLTVSFDGRASYDPNGTIVLYDWDFGDGFTGTGETVSHTYEAVGTYTTSLTVTDNEGSTDTDTITITVERIILGDLNSDGVVNEEDFHLCAKVVLGFEIGTEVLSKADLNQDGNVDVLDLQTIANILVE